MSDSVFKKFTNLYPVTKTLRFELVPTLGTDENLATIKKDREISRLYREEMKPLLDQLHDHFITQALEQVFLVNHDLELFADNYIMIKNLKVKTKKQIKNKDDKQDFDIDEKINKLIKENNSIVDAFCKIIDHSLMAVSQKWRDEFLPKEKLKTNQLGVQLLLQKPVLKILKQRFPDKLATIQQFDKFFTYFTGYQQSRANYYKHEGKATEITHRLFEENLPRFVGNCQTFHLLIASLSNGNQNDDNLKKQLESFTPYLQVSYFNNLLVQDQIDNFNETVVGEINKALNLYEQQNKTKHQKLNVLYKQIGSLKNKKPMLVIEEGEERAQLANFIDEQKPLTEKIVSFYVENFFPNLQYYGLNEIYFSQQAINTISNKWLQNGWQALGSILVDQKILKRNKNGQIVQSKKMKYISMSDLQSALQAQHDQESENFFKSKYRLSFIKSDLWQTFINIWQNEFKTNWEELKEKQEKVLSLIEDQCYKKNDESNQLIHDFFELYLTIEHLTKYNQNPDGGDANFSNQIEAYLTSSVTVDYYNAFRNYLTKKPFSTAKFKLNFDNGMLMGGWSDGQEKIKGAAILRRGENYFLAILLKRNFFDTENKVSNIYTTNSDWSRMILRTLSMKTLSGKGFISRYHESYARMSETDFPKALSSLKEIIKEKYLDKYPKLQEIFHTEYQNKKDFSTAINDILNESYDLQFAAIDESVLREGIENKNVFLFEIKNKDFKEFAHGKKNLETTLFLAALQPENVSKLKLCGGAEIFYRDASLKKKETRPLKCQSPQLLYKKEIINNQRYTENKFFLHLPIQIKSSQKITNLNDKVKQDVVLNINTNIIGIDRGEKNLLYYVIINQKGEILESRSLNIIQMGQKNVNFHQLLTEKASEMKTARQNWQQIGTIKELKAGYLSQVIHLLYSKMLEYNAVIALEDLNAQFMLKRTAKVEKSVYKKFELALAKKLNHLVLKDSQAEELGGVLHPLQLTSKIEAGDISRFDNAHQWGVLFYIRANYTSTTCPHCGWRKHLYKQTKETLANYLRHFDFQYDGQQFLISYIDNSQRKWTLKTNVERLYNKQVTSDKADEQDQNRRWRTLAINVNEKLLNLFNENHLDLDADINKQLATDHLTEQFRKELVWLIERLMQIRNSNSAEQIDYTNCPVCGYHSTDNQMGLTQINDADANGAYNIARKTLMLMQNMQTEPSKSTKDTDYFISDQQWDDFVWQVANK